MPICQKLESTRYSIGKEVKCGSELCSRFAQRLLILGHGKTETDIDSLYSSKPRGEVSSSFRGFSEFIISSPPILQQIQHAHLPWLQFPFSKCRWILHPCRDRTAPNWWRYMAWLYSSLVKWWSSRTLWRAFIRSIINERRRPVSVKLSDGPQ